MKPSVGSKATWLNLFYKKTEDRRQKLEIWNPEQPFLTTIGTLEHNRPMCNLLCPIVPIW